MDFDQIQQRIAKLERHNRLMKRGIFLSGTIVALCFWASVGQAQPAKPNVATLDLNRLRIVAPDGKPVIVLEPLELPNRGTWGARLEMYHNGERLAHHYTTHRGPGLDLHAAGGAVSLSADPEGSQIYCTSPQLEEGRNVMISMSTWKNPRKDGKQFRLYSFDWGKGRKDATKDVLP
jgi:hypothetical protein